MITRIIILWVVGLITIVPYGIYYLLFHAQRDEYALLITMVLFWIFGFWGVVGPIVLVMKIRRVFKALESAQSKEKWKEIIHHQDSQDVAIDLIASENRIPKFLARRIYSMVIKKILDTKDFST
jgi:hypothetical protein